MGGQSGGSAALGQTQWRHAVSVDGVGRVVQVRVGRTAQRQDRLVLGPSMGTPPETARIRVVRVNCKRIKAKNFTIAHFNRS